MDRHPSTEAAKSSSSFTRPGDAAMRAFGAWAVLLAMTVSAAAALVLVVHLFWVKPEIWEALIVNNIRAVVGIPLATASAFCTILLLEARGSY